MSSEFILEALNYRRKEILEKLERINLEAIRELVEKEWCTYTPSEIDYGGLSAVDGGEGRKEFYGYTLYVVTGISLVYSPGPKQYSFVDVDILHPPSVSERISLFREILEGRAALMGARESSISFLDGSLRSILIAPRPLRVEKLREAIIKAEEVFGENIFTDLEAKIIDRLYDYEKTWYDPLVSHDIMRNIALTDEENQAIILLEYIEKLIVYRELLRLNKSGSHELVYISKRSRAQNYFKDAAKKVELPKGTQLPSDIVLFQWFTEEPGYSMPIFPDEMISEDKKRIKKMPEILGLSKFYDKLRVAVSYVRLIPRGPLLKLEIPIVGWIGDLKKRIEHIMDVLYSTHVDGYPYPLIEADKQARIPREVMDNVSLILGLSPVPSGREVLGEWW